MKKSTFEKEFTVVGNFKTVHGRILVTMNYNQKEIIGTNNATHDDFKKTAYVSKVEGFIDNVIHWKELDVMSEHLILHEVQRCETQLREDMKVLANKEKEKCFADKMKILGF